MVRVMDRPLDVRRIYVDAVVELRTEDLRALEPALQNPSILAVRPVRVLAMSGVRWAVRRYYGAKIEGPDSGPPTSSRLLCMSRA